MLGKSAQILPDDSALKRCQMLKITQVAELIGCDRSSVYRLAARLNNPLPIVHINGMARVLLSKFETWLALETQGDGS